MYSDCDPEQKYSIAFLMNGAKPPRGGEFLTLNLIKRLNKDIFHPIMIYAEDGVITEEIKKEGIESIKIPISKNITRVYPRETKILNPFFILMFLWRLILSGAIFKLNKVLRSKDIHLIYSADNLSKLIGGIAGKMGNVKVVAHCHDDFQEDSLGRGMRLFYLLLLDKILTVSEKVRKFFIIKGRISPKAITVYNGIDADVFNPENVDDDLKEELGIKEDAVVIGNIGVLEKDKGQKHLFEAIAKLKSEGVTNMVCVICGAGPEEKSLKDFMKAIGLTGEVLFLGFRDDIPRILKMLDVIVITSLTIESFSMIAAEAMAMKVPVIATNIGGLPEVVDDDRTGILIPPGDVDVLCKAIKYLIENPEERLRMGENGRARVLERFTIEENVRRTEDVFLEMLREN